MSQSPPPPLPPDFPSMEYRPAPSSSFLLQLKIAAIITIVFASLAWLWSLLDAGGRLMFITGAMPMPDMAQQGMTPETAKIFFYIFFGVDCVTGLLAPVVIFGAIQMLRRRMYGFVRFAAVLGMLPIGAHCCFVVTLPMGIWALIVLNQQEVKDAFLANSPYQGEAGPVQ